jgi:hypothetical protein
MTLNKKIWTGNRIFWIVSDVDDEGNETERKIELRRSHRLVAKYPVISREELGRLDATWGYVVSEEIEMPGIASLVLIVHYYKEESAAHRVEGPYRIAE